MARLRYVFILAALALGACVTSKLSGTGESATGNDPTRGTGDETTGDPTCPPNPRFNCTAPYNGSFGPCGDGPLDENCCLPPPCQDDDDCADGEACRPEGLNGFGCADEEVDGELVCQCSANPGGNPEYVCVPDAPPADEWCAAFADETSCNDAPAMESQFCRWIELHTLTIDAANDACKIAGPEAKCLTIDASGGDEEGCENIACSIAQLDFTTPVARAVGTDMFEVWGLNDVFCGGDAPVGDWIAADDPILAQCQMTCGD